MSEEERKLARSTLNFSPFNYMMGNTYPQMYMPGYYSPANDLGLSYHQCIKRCRYFYENDSIAGTVINRMSDIAITHIKNRHKKYKDEIKWYYDGLATIITPLLRQIPLDYLIDGMAIPEYRTDRIMGNRINQNLGRTRYVIPKTTWNRNAEHIIVKKGPMGERILYIRIPAEDKSFIQDKGKPDREEEYRELEKLAPEYIQAVKNGKELFRINAAPIFRKMTSYNTYPLPFLKNAIGPLDYRRSLKRMDKITTDRVSEAIRQISVGSDEYPADDDDIKAAKDTMQSTSGNQENIINVYTNHTIKIQWVIPPLESLLDQTKYVEANADVFLAMGFPRLWAVGENEKSNTADNKIASVGPIATLNSLRLDIIEWLKKLYADMAERNGFTQYPDPYWTPINTAAATELLQYGAEYIKNKTVSRNTGALLFGSDWDTESEQIAREEEILSDMTYSVPDMTKQEMQDNQLEMQRNTLNQQNNRQENTQEKETNNDNPDEG